MTFKELCESMGWVQYVQFGLGIWHKHTAEGEDPMMAKDNNLTAAGAIAVQTEYKITSGPDRSGGHFAFVKDRNYIIAPDIPTAIRDCAMEIEL